MSEKKVHKVYTEEFKRQAVELTIHSGRSIVQISRELGVSDASLHFWRKRYGVSSKPAPASEAARLASPEELLAENRRLQKELEIVKRQRDILKKAMSILGEEPSSSMR